MEKEKKLFAPGYNGELNFSLDFFAKLLLTNPENLSFAIIERKFSDASKIKHPGVLICEIDKIAFDIAEVQFVRSGFFCGDKIKISPAEIVIEEDKFIFTAPKAKITYTRREFMSQYKMRVVNHLLLLK